MEIVFMGLCAISKGKLNSLSGRGMQKLLTQKVFDNVRK